MQKSNLHIFLVLPALLSILFSACEKRESHPVPKVLVNFQINLHTDPEFIRLSANGNSQEISASTLGISYLGYDNNGLLIYNAGDEFYVFDRTCPFDLPESIAIESDGASAIAICPKCGTTYVLPSYGSPTVDGPGGWPLQTYRAYYNTNTGDLQVTN
jgi:hypothetical protein